MVVDTNWTVVKDVEDGVIKTLRIFDVVVTLGLVATLGLVVTIGLVVTLVVE